MEGLQWRWLEKVGQYGPRHDLSRIYGVYTCERTHRNDDTLSPRMLASHSERGIAEYPCCGEWIVKTEYGVTEQS